MKKGSIMK